MSTVPLPPPTELPWPTIHRWSLGGAVNTETLIDELSKALEWFAGSIVPMPIEIDAWLDSKGATLWGDYVISDDDGRKRAAEWLHREITSLFAHAHGARPK